MKYSSSKSSSTLGSFVPSMFVFCISDVVRIIFLTKVQPCHFGWHQGLPAGRAALISLAIQPNPLWAFLFKLQNVFPVFFLSLNCISCDLISVAIKSRPWCRWQNMCAAKCDRIHSPFRQKRHQPECRRTDDHCYSGWKNIHNIQCNEMGLKSIWIEMNSGRWTHCKMW